jgi:hypothetical protein
MDDVTACDELCACTLEHGDPAFIHQLGLTFALIGLYLHVERMCFLFEAERSRLRERGSPQMYHHVERQ